jgi:hypothetical protein
VGNECVFDFKNFFSMSNLTYKEAQELSLKVRWKAAPCFAGEECWCRVIVPEEPIIDKDGNEIEIVSAASISKIHAEHIVEQHNLNLDDTKKKENMC